MTWVLALVLVVSGSVQVTPADPTVGDLITLTFPDPGEGKLSLLPSDQFEIVSVAGAVATVRTFRPGTIEVEAEILTPGKQTQRYSVDVDIRSVLAENDDLQPAPLVFPRQIQPNRKAWWVIGSAAAAVLAVWALLILASRRATGDTEEVTEARSAAEIYLERLNRIARISDEEERWRQLADSTRWILSRIDRSLGPELTTSEVLSVMVSHRYDASVTGLVDRILHGGDWVKFSPFGAPADTSESVIVRARELAGLVRDEEAAA